MSSSAPAPANTTDRRVVAFDLDGEFSYSYLVVLFRNGNGDVYDAREIADPLFVTEDHLASIQPIGEADFTHDRDDFDQLLAMDPDEREDLLNTWFRECINDTLDDPFTLDMEWSSDLTFTQGTEDDLIALLRLFALTEPSLHTGPYQEDAIRIYSGDSDGRDPYLDTEYAYASPRLERLVDLALQDFAFTGHEYEYNDGAHDQRSGYSMNDACVSLDLNDIALASPRERMEARAALRAWLLERNKDPDEYLSDTPIDVEPTA